MLGSTCASGEDADGRNTARTKKKPSWVGTVSPCPHLTPYGVNVTERLPSYENPPVIEVVASVQFEPLAALNVVHLGLLWQRFRHSFPKVEPKPPIAPVVERLGVRVPLNQNQFQLQVSDEYVIPRLWFINEAGDELLQIQQDRFIRNWRAVADLGKPYPRYEDHVRPRFVQDYRAFQQFLQDELGTQAEPNQCEVTYINHIFPNGGWASHKDLHAVFRGWAAVYGDAVEPSIESINCRVVHLLNDRDGEFLGRLHVALQSVFKTQPSELPLFALTLTARGRPTSDGEQGVLGFLDAGRRAIVTAFDNMTTPEMHKIWGKRYDS
jgi:uncharacterized protein (TIGR04255 family)